MKNYSLAVYVAPQRPQVCGLTFAVNGGVLPCRFLSSRSTPDIYTAYGAATPVFLSDSHKVQADSQRKR